MIVPGSANPLLMAQAGDPLDDLGKIERSVRVRRSATPKMTRNFVAPTDGKKWTLNANMKLSSLAGVLTIMSSYRGSNSTADNVAVTVGGQLFLYGATAGVVYGYKELRRLFRDFAAHVNINITYDSTQAVSADRIKISVDGELETSFSQNTAPSLNALSYLNSAGAVNLFANGWTDGDVFDGYASFFSFVDGQALSPSAFGQFHPRTGQWRPKSKAAIRAAVAAGGGARNGWGNNGFFLPFDDPTSLTTLGYDRSQSDTDTTGNNWTANNISLAPGATYDSMLDTPTNNYPTIPAFDNASQTWTVSDGNLSISNGNTGANGYSVRATQAVGAGKYYWEGTITALGSGNDGGFGIIDASWNTSGSANNQYPTVVYLRTDGTIRAGANQSNTATTLQTTSTATTNDVIGVALDMDNKTVQFFKNGAALGVAQSFTGNYMAPAYRGYFNSAAIFNFGQHPFAHTPPAGFNALCTKNLPVKPPVMKSTDAFVAKTNSGANIIADLSAASPWSDWIRIYKRRDAAEGWRWQFSDDAANYLDSSSTAAKAAFPALTGTSYVGYALKVSAQNGIATGRLVHTNGVVSVVTDGLANSRKTILLKNEATGSWFWYHPNLTAGKLLYLDDALTGETTDNTINTVTASGFSVAASLASGIYRWIALADTPGFLSLGGYTTNGVADGPFMNMGVLPKMAFFRLKAASDLPILDTARNAGNLTNSVLYLDGTELEVSAATINNGDIVSNGFKSRCATSVPEDINYQTGFGAIYVAFGQPFRYANAH